MVRFTTVVGVTAIVAVGLTLLLNAVHAGAGIAVASLGLLAVAGGAAIGYYVDSLPELPKARRGATGRRRRGAGATG